jgi:hypothetical protein
MNSAINQILADVEESSEDEVEKGAKHDLESVDGDNDILEDGVKVSKKRKRRLISDSEESDGEENIDEAKESGDDESNDDLGVAPLGEIEYDSDENPIAAKPVKNKMFNKSGKLRKDFLENEAQLSGSEEGSDDEDERGMNKMEMELGDLDDIDDDVERDKVSNEQLVKICRPKRFGAVLDGCRSCQPS